MKTRRSGLTVIEILVVVGIIAILVGLLMPAVHMVQTMAKNTKQRAQFTAIELGLAAFKHDYGDLPPSSWYDPSVPGRGVQTYCGAQKLAEALLGWDLLGFHPDSAWRSDGLAENGTANSVYLASDTLKQRKARYIEIETANPFLLGGGADSLFPGGVGPLEPRTYVLCDVFGRSERRIQLGQPGSTQVKMVTPGSPILYYRANPANLRHLPPDIMHTSSAIYDARDNVPILNLGWLGDATKAMGARRTHRLAPDVAETGFDYFYRYIRDDRIPITTARPEGWSVRPDSYILISAGADGFYGTDDDITNFAR
ncbi:MAG: type II secretion system protein [Solirubrobacterales bacterium]